MSDMIEAWKVPYSYKNFTQININNNKKLHHFIQNIHNLCVTFLVKQLSRGVFHSRFLNRSFIFYDFIILTR